MISTPNSRRPQVSIYVPCFNAGRYLNTTLESLFHQTVLPDEVIVVNDGSSDNTIEIARRFPVQLISHSHNRGLAATRNTAIENAKFDFLASVDADVVPDPTWLEYLLKVFTEPSIAGAGGRLIERFTNSPADRWRALHMNQDHGAARIEFSPPAEARLSGFGTLFRTSALKLVGGYDEKYRTNFEDVDICRKLLRAGYKLIYEPSAVAFHIRQDSPYSVISSQWRWDFWPEFYSGSYNTLAIFFRKLAKNLYWTKELAYEHSKSGDISLLFIDTLYLILFCYWDLRYMSNKLIHAALERI